VSGIVVKSGMKCECIIAYRAHRFSQMYRATNSESGRWQAEENEERSQG